MAFISIYKLPTTADEIDLEVAKEMISRDQKTECRNVIEVEHDALEVLRLLVEGDESIAELRELIGEESTTGANCCFFQEHRDSQLMAVATFKQIGL